MISMISIIAEYFLKVIAFALVLRVLGLFGKQSVLFYIFFCTAAFLIRPVSTLPEFMISSILVFLFMYVVYSTVRNSFRTGFMRFARHAAGLFYRKRAILYSVFVVSFLMMLAGVMDRSLLFIGSFLGFLLLSLAGTRISFERYDPYKILTYRNAAIVAFIFALYNYMFMQMFVGIIIGLLYLALIVLSSLIYDTFTFECPIGALKVGMVAADYVVKKDGKVYRKDLHDIITIQSLVRRRIMLRAEGEHVLISPLRSLSREDIDFLRGAPKDKDFQLLRIQNTVDMRVFVALGAMLSVLVLYIMQPSS